ncbi:homocysteine S-methyltransferase [Coriobacterium glomerans PW2]|uniref:Homocysteine S-methyltransferase n=1 Tax=Coriobacterium glomerans (strain ATCC 49209 / DSM 20642 / JCM 10262 / PW2) TaxID=700015 RepID=F2NAD6_CORGP|nr:homocysteine S-methyltransferase family protein [Coriobacterium glomerans]AEB06322.1 homocysteine S-methyltransferase [Coriobacterium glomerans PW2]
MPSTEIQADFETAYYNRSGAEELMSRLVDEVLLAQGPMGSVLMSEEGASDVPAAYWNEVEPQEVSRIHELYAASGAQLLITNTFQASTPALGRAGISSSAQQVNRAAVDCARVACPQHLAGSIGPCGVDWLTVRSAEFRRARDAYREQAHALLACGVDALMLETFTSVRDLEPALLGAGDVADGMPLLVSFAIDGSADLVGDGLSIEGAILFAEKHGASAVGVNSCSIDAANAAVRRMARAARTPIMVRPGGDVPVRDDDKGLIWAEDPEAFERACRGWIEGGAHLIGGCCGTTARTTASLAEALDRGR